MKNEILQLKDLGRMPNESINDSDSIDELINAYDTLLEQIQLPISFDEAMVLVQIFPENAFYDLQWSLLRLVESVCVDDDRYIQLINSCPSQECIIRKSKFSPNPKRSVRFSSVHSKRNVQKRTCAQHKQ